MSERTPYLKSIYTVTALALLLVYGCSSTNRQAPVSERTPQAARPAPGPAVSARTADPRPEYYTVKRGDTLYSIALDQGLDYKELAEWNGIANPNVIQIGQTLRLRAPVSAAVTTPLKTAPAVEGKPVAGRAVPPAAAAGGDAGVKSQPRAVKLPYSDQALAQLSGQPQAKPSVPAVVAKVEPRPEDKPAASEDDDEKVDWGWPAGGKLLSSFNVNTNLKGIDIAGKLGQPVLATASGKVIYSGTGIRGMGKFIVIKHNNIFLSVYAHNSELLVKYGQAVVKGQKIAEMGDSDTDQIKLHFEIRRFGNAIDPIKLLPPERPA